MTTEIVYRTSYATDGTITVEINEAPPIAEISGALLRTIKSGTGVYAFAASLERAVTVDKVAIGGIFRITAANRTVVYRLVAYDRHWDVWTARWPD